MAVQVSLLSGAGRRGNRFVRHQPRVVQSRNHGEDHRGPQSDGSQSDDPRSLRQLVKDHHRHGQHLGKRVDLAERTWLKVAAARHGVQNRGDKENAEIAAENQYCDPHRHQPLMKQHEKQRAQQQLVRNRIQIFAQHRALLQGPRNQSVERIRNASRQKEDEPHLELIFENCRNQKGSETNAKKCQQVGCGAQWIDTRSDSGVKVGAHGSSNRHASHTPRRFETMLTHSECDCESWSDPEIGPQYAGPRHRTRSTLPRHDLQVCGVRLNTGCAAPNLIALAIATIALYCSLRNSPLRMSQSLTLLVALVLSASFAIAQSTAPNLVLEGKVSGAQNKTYVEVPFEVPAGVHRLSVDFSYTGKQEKTTLDLGIADPQRFRGNSGGNKSHLTIGESDATPSYLPGPIPAGQWKLLLSVPNIRPNQTSTYRAEIRFNNPAEDQGFTRTPLENEKRWYRGDLHMHTADSDGSCASQSGKSVPCPVFFTAEVAAQRGLDFIAITDHNTTSQYEAMRELQPYFDRLLLIPGREITTFWGHFNIFGVTQYVDYRVVNDGIRDVNAVLRDVRALGGIASINHADAPGGEICMGCAWEPRSRIDLSLLTGVEVINGGGHFQSSADFWDRQLATGAHLTAIGGSDNHNAPKPAGDSGAIGWPTTVVEASDLSVPAILDGIRRGRAFIDLTGSRDRILDLKARDAGHDTPGQKTDRATEQWTLMGSTLMAEKGDALDLRVELSGCEGSTVHLFVDGRETPALGPLTASSKKDELPFHWMSDGGPHWLRAEVRDANGSLMLVSNPIYVQAAAH